MENLVDMIIELDYDEIDDFQFPTNKLFGLKINFSGILYCFIIKFSNSNPNLVCFGPGAHSRNSVKSSGESINPPYFDRWSWHQYLDESFIAYSDPMFFDDDEIVLGWFIGQKNQWYLETVSLIITKLSINQGILPENTLFFGSSGGGFSSVCLGTLIKGSKVMVNNAQFFVLNFTSPTHVLEKLFNILEKDFDLEKHEIVSLIKYRMSVIELFKKEKYVPEITYYINLESKFDINSQTLPLIEEIQKLDFLNNDLNIQFYRERKEDPHNPMPFDKTISCIRNHFSSKNFFKIGKIFFYYPKNFYQINFNPISISNDKYTISFLYHPNSNIDACLNNYLKMKQNDGFSVYFTKSAIKNIVLYKSTILNYENTVHFWFEYDDDVYEIYSWNGDSTLELLVLDLVKLIF